MEVGHVVLRSRAALDEVEVGTLIHDDEGVLELARTGGVQAEVGLQRDLHMHPGGNVHEGAAAPHCPVQGRELVIGGGHQLHEVALDHVGVGAGEGAFHVGVDDALRGHLGFDVVVDHLGVVLRPHAGQRSPLGLGNAQALKGVLDVLRHLAPLAPHLGVGADVGDDIAHIQPFDGRAPVLHRHLVVNLKALLAERTHPLRVVLFLGNFGHDVGCQAGIYLKGGVCGVLDVVNAAVHFGNVGLFGLKGSHFASSSFSAWKPSSMISFTRLPSPVRTMRASSSTCTKSTFRPSRILALWVMMRRAFSSLW